MGVKFFSIFFHPLYLFLNWNTALPRQLTERLPVPTLPFGYDFVTDAPSQAFLVKNYFLVGMTASWSEISKTSHAIKNLGFENHSKWYLEIHIQVQ